MNTRDTCFRFFPPARGKQRELCRYLDTGLLKRTAIVRGLRDCYRLVSCVCRFLQMQLAEWCLLLYSADLSYTVYVWIYRKMGMDASIPDTTGVSTRSRQTRLHTLADFSKPCAGLGPACPVVLPTTNFKYWGNGERTIAVCPWIPPSLLCRAYEWEWTTLRYGRLIES